MLLLFVYTDIAAQGENKDCPCINWSEEIVEGHFDTELGDYQQKILKQALEELPELSPPKCYLNTDGDNFEGEPKADPSDWCVCSSAQSAESTAQWRTRQAQQRASMR